MIVCADDFGYRSDIDEAVLQLVRRGRITAVSCMMGAPHTNEGTLRELVSLTSAVDFGLHLAFTADARPLSPVTKIKNLVGADGRFPSFPGLLSRCLLGHVTVGEAALETKTQCEQFLALTGRTPDFVDGHLHVHQFPRIREGVLQYLATLAPASRPYVRNTAVTFSRSVRQGVSIWKTQAIGWFGAAFRDAAIRTGLRTNSGFGGVYDYSRYRRFPDFLRRFAAVMKSKSDLLMVHPGLSEPWRKTEYETMLAAEWLAPQLNRFDEKR